jgi:homoserine kinase
MLQISGHARMSMMDDDGILCRTSGRDEDFWARIYRGMLLLEVRSIREVARQGEAGNTLSGASPSCRDYCWLLEVWNQEQ